MSLSSLTYKSPLTPSLETVSKAISYLEKHPPMSLSNNDETMNTCIRMIQGAISALSTVERVVSEGSRSIFIHNEDLDPVAGELSGFYHRMKQIPICVQDNQCSSVLDVSGERKFDLVNSIRNQFRKILQPIQELQDLIDTFSIRMSPLLSVHLNIQNLKKESIPKHKSEFLRIFHSLSEQDKNSFIESFVKHGMSEEDKTELLVIKHSIFFKSIAGISNEAAQKDITKALVSTLKKDTVVAQDHRVIELMPERIDALALAFDDFLLKKIKSASREKLEAISMLLRKNCYYYSPEDLQKNEYLLPAANDQPAFRSDLIVALDALDKKQSEFIFQKLKSQCQEKSGQGITERLFKYCPIIDAVRKGINPGFSEEMVEICISKANRMQQLENTKDALVLKYPSLKVAFNDSSHVLYKMWKEMEMEILLCRFDVASCSKIENPLLRTKELFDCLDSLLNDQIDTGSAEILLEVILKRNAIRPRGDSIQGQLDLREIRGRGVDQATRNQFSVSSESRCKSVYTIRDKSDRTIGKYKPNLPGVAAREVKGYVYDCILGVGITPPTGFAYLSMETALLSLKSAFQLADKKLKMALAYENSNEVQLAKMIRSEANELHRTAMDQFANFPDEIKRGIYGSLSSRFAHENFDEGSRLWWDSDLSAVSDKNRLFAIEDFLSSQSFQHFKMANSFETNDKLGSIQRWINEPQKRVIEFIVQDSKAGSKLKRIPKAQVHLYCLLGLIKGSRDGFSGNALVTFNEKGEIKRIHEFDDERSMPTVNQFHEFRLWQFGLPQADKPFDRTTLLLFSNPKLLKQIQACNRLDKRSLISTQAYQAQEQRVAKIIDLFQKELTKTEITLTPRELFFEVVGGRENFEHWNTKEKLNPWHVFEYCTGDVGRGSYFCDEGSQNALKKNFDSLYEDSQKILREITVFFPKTKLVVKCNAGYGNNLYIKGTLPGLDNWSVSHPLKCLNEDTWIFESNQEILGGEFKIYLNGAVEEVDCSNRKVEADSNSRVIHPEF